MDDVASKAMKPRKTAFNLETCARPNILSLQPYRCARDDYKDDGKNILLDANENAHGPGLDTNCFAPWPNSDDEDCLVEGRVDQCFDVWGLNRYPDPHQEDLKQRICDYRNAENPDAQAQLGVSNLFLGVGSDEVIDAIQRCFCRPGQDKILTCPPTYGMYAVSAQVNDLAVVHVPLDVDNGFALRPSAIKDALSDDRSIKVAYFCSPGNPTGKLISRSSVEDILSHPTWNGVVVVDEAYIDFSEPGSSLSHLVLEYPNLIVMQTLSKAFGFAGLRLGFAITSPPIARLLNNLKAPYNISSPTSALATQAFSPESLEVMQRYRLTIFGDRKRLVRELPRIPGIGRLRGGTDANFILFELLSSPASTSNSPNSNSDTADASNSSRPSNEVALAVYKILAEKKGVVVRFRGKEFGCEGCLRVTVGNPAEVSIFLKEMHRALQEVYRAKGLVGAEHGAEEARLRDGLVNGPANGGEKEQGEQMEANDVIA